MSYEQAIAGRVSHLKASAIREIFKLIGQADIISMAGGAPAPESFPGEELSQIAADILKNSPQIALQYGTTEGYVPLQDMVRERMRAIDCYKENDELIIVSGGQQGIDFTLKSMVNDFEGVIVEEPSFIGTLNSARSYNAKLFGVPVLEDGMDLDMAEEILKKENIKIIYTIPTFQNPSGITMSLEKRKRLLALAEKYDVYIIEDNPYGELRFSGDCVPNIKSLDTNGRVIYVGSFSKILSPGLRLGWTVAPAPISDRIAVVKQVSDVHTALLNQMMAAEFMRRYSMEEHIEKLCKMYKERCEMMLASMEQYFPDNVQYTRPCGGIFIYCTLPKGSNTIELFAKALEKKVAFVPGHTFMVDIDTPANTFRLNYSAINPQNIDKGIRILSEVIKENIK